ncbi:MAG: thioredoxin [Ginsengibacter sp.]
MKKILLLFLSATFFATGFAQEKSDQPVYLRFPVIPQFTVYKAPDSTAFTRENLQKKRPVMFMVFSPDCGHCQHETEAILANIKDFKNTQIVMVTYLPFEEMMTFYKTYRLSKYPQITVARDTKFFFPVFYKVQNLPAIYIYDKKGDFKKGFEGSVKIDSLIAEL